MKLGNDCLTFFRDRLHVNSLQHISFVIAVTLWTEKQVAVPPCFEAWHA